MPTPNTKQKIDEVFSALKKEIKPGEIRKGALDWIDDLRQLAKKYPHNKEKIDELVVAAEVLLDLRTGVEQVHINRLLSKIDEIPKPNEELQVEKVKNLLGHVKNLWINNNYLNYVKAFIIDEPTLGEKIKDPPEILTANFKAPALGEESEKNEKILKEKMQEEETEYLSPRRR